MDIDVGTRIGPYEIRGHLGAGGMGEVYLAQDTRLGRRVALKFLQAELTGNKEHLHRFEQEARATSALNHPNIITIHEIGKSGSSHFIAAEFIEGVTLRELLGSGPIKLGEALDIAIQVASGLAVAHAAGVVHRDIKPENIMVRPDGYVKILDFGLAKLAEDAWLTSGDSGEATVTNVKTNSGAVVGTVSYMSPEQLRGEPINTQTDIWSFGVVLYEMLAGRSPFAGTTAAVTITSILEGDPPPLSRFCPECPPEVERKIKKLLSVSKELRYQSATEVLEELHRLKRDLEKGDLSPRPVEPRADTERRREGGDSWGLGKRVAALASRIASLAAHRRAAALTLMATAAILIVALILNNRTQDRLRANSSFQAINPRKLTAMGKVSEAAISSDGKYVAYILEEGGYQSLWVRQVTVDNNKKITDSVDAILKGPTFSPDNNFIYYTAYEERRNNAVLYKIGVLGGIPVEVLDDVDTPISFSPAGDRFTFVRGFPSERATTLMIADADGSSQRPLATRRAPDEFGWRGGPAWSPDGRSIVCATGYYDYRMSLVEIDVEDGSMKEVSPNWLLIGRVLWLKDQSGLLMIAKDQASTISQIWHVSYPDYTARRVTNDLNDYNVRSISISSDMASVVAVQTDFVSSIWVAPDSNAALARQITSDRSDGINGLSWTKDDKIVYASDVNGNHDIWITDGVGRKQLTSNGHSNYHPSVSPDGRYIVFTSNRDGTQNIWRMDMDGKNQKQLTRGWNAVWPSCSPDGKWVVYKSYVSGKRTLWRVSIDGGDSVEISDRHSGLPAVSPDGDHIACEYWDEGDYSAFKLAIISSKDGSLVNQFNFPQAAPSSRSDVNVVRWRGSRSITYTCDRDGVSNIWMQAVDGGPPRQLTNFIFDKIFWFDWSPDGKKLACARGRAISDAVLISLQKN